jgi:hypothetical protein
MSVKNFRTQHFNNFTIILGYFHFYLLNIYITKDAKIELVHLV